MQQTRRTYTQPMIYLKPTPLRPEEAARLGLDPNTRRIVRMPEYDLQPLPAEGMWVPQTQYWLSHIADGSAEKAEPPAGSAAPAAPPPASLSPPRRAPKAAN